MSTKPLLWPPSPPAVSLPRGPHFSLTTEILELVRANIKARVTSKATATCTGTWFLLLSAQSCTWGLEPQAFLANQEMPGLWFWSGCLGSLEVERKACLIQDWETLQSRYQVNRLWHFEAKGQQRTPSKRKPVSSLKQNGKVNGSFRIKAHATWDPKRG